LHSLTGIIPVGVFLCVHLSVNASIIAGASAFQFAVDQIHTLAKLGILKVVEVCFIFAPIAFHAALGVVIWLSGRSNVGAYRYGGNVRYTLQRWTGIIAIVFILAHLWHVHWIIPGGAEFDPHAAASTAVTAMASWWTAPVYVIGLLSAVFHFANGIWTFLITWGITVGPRSQRISGRVCTAIGIVLALFGLGSLVTLKTMDAEAIASPPLTQDHAAILGDPADPSLL
jgi:succinate dehydrogenase / fumarate reductase cytochrome b subunit